MEKYLRCFALYNYKGYPENYFMIVDFQKIVLDYRDGLSTDLVKGLMFDKETGEFMGGFTVLNTPEQFEYVDYLYFNQEKFDLILRKKPSLEEKCVN